MLPAPVSLPVIAMYSDSPEPAGGSGKYLASEIGITVALAARADPLLLIEVNPPQFVISYLAGKLPDLIYDSLKILWFGIR